MAVGKKKVKQSAIRSFKKKFSKDFPKITKSFAWFFRLLLIIIFIDIGYLIAIWPDWKWYSHGPIPISRFIEDYARTASQNHNLPRLRWKTIESDNIPKHMMNAVLAAEDARFFQHEGVDTDALKKAMEYNWNRKSIVYGASTISQQTIKNLFLSGSKNPLRKWHEYLLTFTMENNLSKKRILEIYLNIAEFGKGIYGIEAATQYYWGKSAAKLSKLQAIELAATLPAPVKHNPKSRTQFFMKNRKKIKRNMGM